MMWFDPYKALAEIEARGACDDPPSASPQPVLSVVSVLSEGGQPIPPAATGPGRIAQIARIARPPVQNPEIGREAARPEDLPAPEAFAHGRSVTGKPLTWTGRVVSLEAWRRLSDWERHGSTGKMWNGLSRQWEPMEGGAHDPA